MRALLPPEVEETLRRHEEAGTTDDPEYVEACLVFYGRHVCRIEWPPEVAEAFAWIERDPTVYHTMNGPSEFHVIGSIRDWQSKDRLGEIDVPTLLVSAVTTRRRRRCSRCCSPESPARSGSASRTRPTCRTSRSASATCRSWATGSRSTTERPPDLSSVGVSLPLAAPAPRSLAEDRRLGRHGRRGRRVRARFRGRGGEALPHPVRLDGAHAPLRAPRRGCEASTSDRVLVNRLAYDFGSPQRGRSSSSRPRRRRTSVTCGDAGRPSSSG